MYLIFTLVLGLVLFVLVYAKYVRAVGAVSKRTKEFEALRKRMELHVRGLQDTNIHLKGEIQMVLSQIEKLERQLDEMAEVSGAGGRVSLVDKPAAEAHPAAESVAEEHATPAFHGQGEGREEDPASSASFVASTRSAGEPDGRTARPNGANNTEPGGGA